MLEMCPLALYSCGSDAPPRWHSHSWLCSVPPATAALPNRLTAPKSAWPCTAGSGHFCTQIATDLESYSCTSTSGTSVESYSCEKSRGAPAPTTPIQRGEAWVPHRSISRVWFFPARPRGGANLMPLLTAPNLPEMGFTAARLTAGLSSGLSGLRAHQAGPSSPLECALTPKPGWGVPPPAGFSQ